MQRYRILFEKRKYAAHGILARWGLSDSEHRKRAAAAGCDGPLCPLRAMPRIRAIDGGLVLNAVPPEAEAVVEG